MSRRHYSNQPEWQSFLNKFDYPVGKVSKARKPKPGRRWVYNDASKGVSFYEKRDEARNAAGLKPSKAA